jgi:hypothetical protein
MKKNKLLLISFIFLSMTANSQITKNNWLVGGNGRLAFRTQTTNVINAKSTNLGLSPNVGYFFVDKLAAGARISLNYDKVNFSGGVSKTTQIGIGPFIRYYFLNPDNIVNLFSEAGYQYIHSTSNSGNTSDGANSFTFSSGPVIYFNSSVGMELTLNYESYKSASRNTNLRTFFITIGFQIHLQKEKDY